MKTAKYKSTGRIGFFDKDEASAKLSKLGNPLEKLHKVIDFEMFRSSLEENMLNQNKKSSAGCKPFDVVMMFKIILLKRFYNLSDEQAEYQINDRLSFNPTCRFFTLKIAKNTQIMLRENFKHQTFCLLQNSVYRKAVCRPPRFFFIFYNVNT